MPNQNMEIVSVGSEDVARQTAQRWQPRDELSQRVVEFQRDHWAQLIREANECSSLPSLVPPRTPEEEAIRKGLAAQSRVQRGRYQEPVRF